MKKILMVDDEQPIREMYSLFFSNAGYMVKTAKSTEDAIKFPVIIVVVVRVRSNFFPALLLIPHDKYGGTYPPAELPADYNFLSSY